ncbi:MAG: acyl-CoA thioesterase, partial [Bacteroidetes bacterium]|nr:acyl-CoA thioesterase [Bacteroidota bacterium]
TLTELVFPNYTNALNNLMGGQLLLWMDVASAIAASRHSETICVTAAVNNVSFNEPIGMGDVVTIEAKVSCVFKTSLEVYIDVYVEKKFKKGRHKTNEAIYSFVAVDKKGKPMIVPPLIPETDEEKERQQGAIQRKELSLIKAGKLDPKDATELKSMFE